MNYDELIKSFGRAAVVIGVSYLGYRLIRPVLERNMSSAAMALARGVGEDIGIDWSTSPFSVNQFARGIFVELEHGSEDPRTDVTGDDLYATGKIAWAHLNEFPDYYDRLELMEQEAKEYWGR
jgi:hypothetical protein